MYHSNEEGEGASNNRRTAAQTRLWFWRWEGRKGGMMTEAGRQDEGRAKPMMACRR